MIQIGLFDYSENREIDIEVTKYVNENLAAIILVVLDLLNDNCGFELNNFLPRDYLERKPEECRRLVDELYELIESDFIRDCIKPKYGYLLYTILSWWEDLADEESDLIPNPIENELLKRIKEEETYLSEEDDDCFNVVLQQITSYEAYYYICFPDHDFLSDQLSMLVTLYLQNPNLFNKFYADVNLEEYEDLMPSDLREQYREKISARNTQNLDKISIEQGIIFEIITTLQSLEQRVVEIEKRDEVEISNDINGILNRTLKVRFGLDTAREMTIGRADKKLGETDIYIYENNAKCRTDYAIIENKLIENFKSQYQQLLGYLNQNFKFGVTISINKKFKLSDAVANIIDKLNEIKEKDMDFQITSIYKPYKEFPYVIKSSHIIPEDHTKEISIYHLILNLYDIERKNVAKVARRR